MGAVEDEERAYAECILAGLTFHPNGWGVSIMLEGREGRIVAVTGASSLRFIWLADFPVPVDRQIVELAWTRAQRHYQLPGWWFDRVMERR
jgi:hypothetical protein